MDLVIGDNRRGGKRKGRLQARFEELRTRVERARRRDAGFRRDLDQLVETYHRRSTETDRRVLDELVALSRKLIVFAGRKSLSEWHRGELGDWVMDLVDRRIRAVDASTADRLQLEYREAIARSMGISDDELVDLFESAFGHVDGDPAEPDPEPEPDPDPDPYAEGADADPWQDDLFGFDDVDAVAGSQPGDDASGPDEAEGEAETRHHVGQAIMDGRWAKDLFRRAAQALHPDREPDPERQRFKHERMRELLRARRHGDVMTMLEIYSESVSGGDIVVAEQEMRDICEALEHQLTTIERERLEYIEGHPIRQMVFDLFYHGTKKERERRIAQWESELAREGPELRELVAYLRNLSRLKSVLAARRDEREGFLAEMLFSDERFG